MQTKKKILLKKNSEENMIFSVVLSKPTSNIENVLGKPYEKIKINIENANGEISYFAQMFTKTQVFHKHFSEDELLDFLAKNEGITFKNCIKKNENQEITTLTNKKGKITVLKKSIKNEQSKIESKLKILPQKKKNYILEEGTPIPFLVFLGIMNDKGKVIKSKYDKFRQINRFLEFIDDVISEIKTSPIYIADFGCGKSYLTFAVHYFLTEIKHIPCKIEGLDLKQDVIDFCNDVVKKINLQNINFHIGNIASYEGKHAPDLVITLHACDTATDFALKYAVSKNAKVILSVPCCQHEINSQLNKRFFREDEFEPLLKWGIIKERFASLVTDSLRGEWLESQGYKVQMLEFIDMEHTPKNILIRAIKNTNKKDLSDSSKKLIEKLEISPTIEK